MAGWVPLWLLPLPPHLRIVGDLKRRRKRPVVSSAASQRRSSMAPWKKRSASLLTPRLRPLSSRGSPNTPTQKTLHSSLSQMTVSSSSFSVKVVVLEFRKPNPNTGMLSYIMVSLPEWLLIRMCHMFSYECPHTNTFTVFNLTPRSQTGPRTFKHTHWLETV